MKLGAETLGEQGVRFRVWAPGCQRVGVSLGELSQSIALQREEGGFWTCIVREARAGMHYRYQLDSGGFPDPASRFQPEGPHGPSRIIDPASFGWEDDGWAGIERKGQVIYEMHIGTFTAEGTWRAAETRIPHLMDLGVTVIELMPVADFTGSFGWGYDGVNLFAPMRLYGEPDDFRSFVNQAHRAGLGVILDVVYNHFGPDGNYLPEFSPDYFTDRYKNDWGEPINFDGKASEAVRQFYLANAAYWIREFHLDGLRLDATQQIFDATKPNIMELLTTAVREAAGGRKTFIVAENEPQDVRLIRPSSKGGYGMDALWNDDFHHAAVVAMTGRNEAYYTDYHGSAQEFVSAAKWGFLYQGQRYKWQRGRRGTPSLDFEPENFVNYLQNHDQVANSLWGHRIHTLTSAGRLRALTALLLLGPNTPMLFQGQEFAASSPFLYFADHTPELAEVVRKGRAEFLSQFPSIASSDTAKLVANPGNRETFQRCKLDFADRERNATILQLHKDLIRLRRTDPLLGAAPRGTYDGAVLTNSAFVLHFFGRAQDDRLLVVNLSERIHLDPAPEPLLAPPLDCEWAISWSSEDPRYGGSGTPPLDSEENWNIPAESAVLLIPAPRKG